MKSSDAVHGPLYYAFRRFTENKSSFVAGIFILILALAALSAPLITPASYESQAFLDEALAFPSTAHWFGVDNVGRDLYSRIVYGARVSLGIGLVSALASVLIGVPLGAIAGYYGGAVDWFVMRLVELFSVIPPFLIAILAASLLGGGVFNIIMIASAFGWVQVARLVRGQVISVKTREFILAARGMGARSRHIITRHLIPNSVSPIIIGFVLAIPQAMMLEASLSFLGVGINPPTPSWGQMISDGIYFLFFYWHLPLFPTLFLAVTVLATSVFGDGLRDALDPTLKGR
jgi:peptide/nickel transport system permease protein/oligopeptide transport system permease protein